MNIIKAHNLACPIEGKSLQQVEKQFVCDNRHSYDIARHGYVNLLPVQYKRSKEPGDSKAMVNARTKFLETGIYQTISSKLNDTVLGQIINGKNNCILDAGCGEGYYLDNLAFFLNGYNSNNDISLIGLDISKEAIIRGSKRNKLIRWVVGTNRQPPILENSVDIIICMFGFMNTEGFKKILKHSGKIILVEPGINHLKELREIVYSEIISNDDPKSYFHGFNIIKSDTLNFKKTIYDKDQIQNLLVMTPHFYRASREGKEAASNLESLDISIDVTIKVLVNEN